MKSPRATYITQHISAYQVSRINSFIDATLSHNLRPLIIEINQNSHFYTHPNPQRLELLKQLSSESRAIDYINFSFETLGIMHQLKALKNAIILTRNSTFTFHVGYSNLFSLLVLIFSKTFTKSPSKNILGIDSRLQDSVKNPITTALKKLILYFFDYAFTASKESSTYLESLGMSPRSCYRPFYLSLPCSTINDSDRKHELLIVSRLSPRKNIMHALKSYFKVHQLLIAQNLRTPLLRIIGNGEQYSEANEFIKCHGLTDNIILMSDQSFDVVKFYLAHAKIAILASLKDQFGIFAMEAFCFNTFLLCSKYAGASELCVPTLNGDLFDPYDSEDLANKLFLYLSGNIPSHDTRLMVNKAITYQYSPQAFKLNLISLFNKTSDKLQK